MTTRRKFLLQSGALSASTLIMPTFTLYPPKREKNLGVQLYTFRDELEKDVLGTLEQIASIGIKKIESARSSKGHYYGLTPREMKNACADLGMKLVSGHVHLDDHFQKTMDEAAESGQEYLICSSMPSEGQTIDNYLRVAEKFNEAGEACKKMGLKFGYHNHGYEFDSDSGEVLYDLLLNNTDEHLVHMELDLGWVVMAGKDPIDYFERFSGRFPLWHLKDMSLKHQESTEFGKGDVDINRMIAHKKASGVKHIFIEQEEYSSTPLESMKANMEFLNNL
jgi:sugar phosphate isomerase/epimerase